MNIDMTLPLQFIFMLTLGGTLALWILSLVDCIQNETPRDKPLWLALLLFAGGVVGLIYWFWRKPQRERERFQARLNTPSTELADAIQRVRGPGGVSRE